MRITNNAFSDLPMFLSKNFFTNDINLKKDAVSIKESIKNIVLTRFGERPFDLNFTGYIYDILFENVVESITGQYKVHIANIVNLYEPRVNVTDVIIELDEDTARTINIEIVYEILSFERIDTVTISVERTR
jgi:phage baseplate assembly protein W